MSGGKFYDVTGTRRTARVLLDGLEALARERDRGCIVIGLRIPMTRRRRRKCFEEPG